MEARTDAYSTYNQINIILNRLKIIFSLLGHIGHNGDPKGVRPTSKGRGILEVQQVQGENGQRQTVLRSFRGVQRRG